MEFPEPTLAQIRAAAATLPDTDKGQSGAYHIVALNGALKKMKLGRVNAARRDLAMTGADDGPEGQITITLIDAPDNPVTLYVHGRGHHSIRVGETKSLPREGVEVLRQNPAIKFEEE